MKDILMDLLSSLFTEIINWFKYPFERLMMMLFEWIFGGLNSGLMTAFNDPILEAICYVATIFSWCIFIFAMPFYFLKIAKEERRNWAVIFNCVVETVVFISLNQLLAKVCFVIPNMIISAFELDVYTLSWFRELVGAGAWDLSFDLMVFVVLLVGLIAFTVVTVMRVGAMLTQMIIAPFYVGYVLLGDHQKVSEWVLGTVAAGFTYAVQYVLFYAGVLILCFSNLASVTDVFIRIAIGTSTLFAAFAAPKALQKFGWSSGAAHTFQSTATSATMLAMRFLPK